MIVDFPHCTELPDLLNGQVQTRSEETGIIQHDTLQEAYELAKEDKTIWKISYNTPDGWRRIVIR